LKIYSTISIAKFFEEEEPKKSGRNLFKLDEEQKQEMEEERILYRIKKQKNIQKYFEQKALAFDKKIQKAEEKLRKNRNENPKENKPPSNTPHKNHQSSGKFFFFKKKKILPKRNCLWSIKEEFKGCSR